MGKFLGIVRNRRFTVLVPYVAHCCSVRLTRISRPAWPASIAEDQVASREIDLTEYECKACVVSGILPEYAEWLYEADVIDQAAPC